MIILVVFLGWTKFNIFGLISKLLHQYLFNGHCPPKGLFGRFCSSKHNINRKCGYAQPTMKVNAALADQYPYRYSVTRDHIDS